MDPKDVVAITAAILLAAGRGASQTEAAAQVKGVVELARQVVRESRRQVREAQDQDNTDV